MSSYYQTLCFSAERQLYMKVATVTRSTFMCCLVARTAGLIREVLPVGLGECRCIVVALLFIMVKLMLLFISPKHIKSVKLNIAQLSEASFVVFTATEEKLISCWGPTGSPHRHP